MSRENQRKSSITVNGDTFDLRTLKEKWHDKYNRSIDPQKGDNGDRLKSHSRQMACDIHLNGLNLISDRHKQSPVTITPHSEATKASIKEKILAFYAETISNSGLGLDPATARTISERIVPQFYQDQQLNHPFGPLRGSISLQGQEERENDLLEYVLESITLSSLRTSKQAPITHKASLERNASGTYTLSTLIHTPEPLSVMPFPRMPNRLGVKDRTNYAMLGEFQYRLSAKLAISFALGTDNTITITEDKPIVESLRMSVNTQLVSPYVNCLKILNPDLTAEEENQIPFDYLKGMAARYRADDRFIVVDPRKFLYLVYEAANYPSTPTDYVDSLLQELANLVIRSIFLKGDDEYKEPEFISQMYVNDIQLLKDLEQEYLEYNSHCINHLMTKENKTRYRNYRYEVLNWALTAEESHFNKFCEELTKKDLIGFLSDESVPNGWGKTIDSLLSTIKSSAQKQCAHLALHKSFKAAWYVKIYSAQLDRLHILRKLIPNKTKSTLSSPSQFTPTP